MRHNMSNSGKNRILRSIARIGSKPFQHRFCLQGTVQEFVMIDELVETTLSRVELEITNPILAKKWSCEELDALRDFLDEANTLFDQIAWKEDSLELTAIVDEDTSMQSIRDTANNCLKKMQVNFSLDDLMVD